MAHKNHYEIAGKTIEGKLVISGTFKMYDTAGMPLPIMFTLMSLKGMIPDPIDFYESAIKAGWKPKTIFTRLEEAYLDGYSKKFWEEVERRLTFYINLNLNEKN